MMRNKFGKKVTALLLAACAALFLTNGTVLWAAPQKTAPFSVDAQEIEYDLNSGDGTATGKTTIKQEGGTAVAQGGATFNSKTRTGRLYGGVVADKEDQHLRSNEVILHTETFISAIGNARLTKGDKTLEAPRVDYHDDSKYAETLGGSARLSSTDGSWLTASKITYDMKSGMATATGGVNLENKPQNMTGSGDRAIYNSNDTGYVELIGNAKATRDGNTVTGDKLRITNMSGPDSKTHASGNVRIVYFPAEEKQPTASGTAATAGTASGTTKALAAKTAGTEDKKA